MLFTFVLVPQMVFVRIGPALVLGIGIVLTGIGCFDSILGGFLGQC